MAALRARHSLSCALSKMKGPSPKGQPQAEETIAPSRGKVEGCDCKPSFLIRYERGKTESLSKHDRKDLKAAWGALHALEKRLERGEVVVADRRTFEQWAKDWLELLPNEGVTENTLRTYRTMVDMYAIPAFGDVPLNKVAVTDVDRMKKAMRGAGIASATRNKHLRGLSACLNDAYDRDLRSGKNPVKQEKVKDDPSRGTYFTRAELKRLIPEIPDGVYRTLNLVALKTGMRQGELVGLHWKNVDFENGVIHVREQFTAGEQRANAKSATSRRDVAMIPEPDEEGVDRGVAFLLAQWWTETGRPGDKALVFEREGHGGPIPSWVATRQILYPAMKRAGVPRENSEDDDKTRDFHSFRHTFAKTYLENGGLMYGLSQFLGHSSISVTEKNYAKFETSAKHAEAVKIGVGGFGV